MHVVDHKGTLGRLTLTLGYFILGYRDFCSYVLLCTYFIKCLIHGP